MKNNKISVHGLQVGSRLGVSLNGVRVVIGMLALSVGIGAAVAPLRVGAAPYAVSASALALMDQVYLYNSDGNPIAEPDATLTDGNVYTDDSFVGTVDDNDNILDSNNNIIGYVVPGPGR